MTDLMVIAVSVAVSLIADIAIDCGLLIRKGVGSREYRNALKLAKNNKDVVDRQNIIKDMNEKISKLEHQINSFPKSVSENNNNFTYLKNEIRTIKESLELYTHSDSLDVNKIVALINDLSSRLSQLENQCRTTPSENKIDCTEFERKVSNLTNQVNSLKGELNNYASLKDKINKIESSLLRIHNEIQNITPNTPTVFDSSKLESKISTLQTDIKNLKTTINTNDAQSQLVQVVRQLSSEIVNLKQIISSQQKTIDSLKNSSVNTITTTPIPKSTTSVIPKIQKSSVHEADYANVITPNEEYVEKLQQNVSEIKGHLGEWELKNYQEGLKKILTQGDFDDGEEIIGEIHELIKKYIYGSDTKVSATDWDILEKYIINAGYTPVPVKSGDDITPFKSYFDRPIPANGGIPNTIKQIQLRPFVLMYDDCGEKEEIKLCGKCTYYR